MAEYGNSDIPSSMPLLNGFDRPLCAGIRSFSRFGFKGRCPFVRPIKRLLDNDTGVVMMQVRQIWVLFLMFCYHLHCPLRMSGVCPLALHLAQHRPIPSACLAQRRPYVPRNLQCSVRRFGCHERPLKRAGIDGIQHASPFHKLIGDAFGLKLASFPERCVGSTGIPLFLIGWLCMSHDKHTNHSSSIPFRSLLQVNLTLNVWKVKRFQYLYLSPKNLSFIIEK